MLLRNLNISVAFFYERLLILCLLQIDKRSGKVDQQLGKYIKIAQYNIT